MFTKQLYTHPRKKISLQNVEITHGPQNPQKTPPENSEDKKAIEDLVNKISNQESKSNAQKLLDELKRIFESKYKQKIPQALSTQIRIIQMFLDKSLYQSKTGKKVDEFESEYRNLHKALGIKTPSIIRESSLTPELRAARETVANYFAKKVQEGIPLTVRGKISNEIFREIESEIKLKYPNIPQEKLNNFFSSIKASILKDEDTFGLTSIKRGTYEVLNKVKNIPGGKEIQEALGRYLRNKGVLNFTPDDNIKERIVDDFIDNHSLIFGAIRLTGEKNMQSIKNILHGLVDMFYDLKNVTLNGGEFKNTAADSIKNIVSNSDFDTSSKITSTDSSGKITTKTLKSEYEKGISNMSYKSFQAMMNGAADPISFIKKEIGVKGYENMCLFMSSRGFQTSLYNELPQPIQETIRKDSQIFEDNFEKSIKDISTIPDNLIISGVPKEIIQKYFSSPTQENLAYIIKMSGKKEYEISDLLEEIKKKCNEQIKRSKDKIVEIPEKTLETEIDTQNGKKKFRLLTPEDYRFILGRSEILKKENPELLKNIIEYQKYIQAKGVNTSISTTTKEGILLARKKIDGGELTKDEERRLNLLEKKNQIAVNISNSQASSDIIQLTNKLPDNQDLSNPIQVEQLLKSGKLTSDQAEALRMIRNNHRNISDQINIYENQFGSDEARNFINKLQENNTIMSNGNTLLYEQYKYLGNNIYEAPPGVTGETIRFIANMGPDDPSILIHDRNGSSFFISTEGNQQRVITDVETGITLENVPFQGVISTIREINYLKELGIGKMAQFIPQINKKLRDNGYPINSFDGSFTPEENQILIKSILRLMKFDPITPELENNLPGLEKFMKDRISGLQHSLDYHCMELGLYDENYNPIFDNILKSIT